MPKKIITFGEILLRLSPPNYLKLNKTDTLDVHYGGAEANVAASLAICGMDVKFVTAVPENVLGDAALNGLQYYGVRPLATKQGHRLGVYYFEHGASDRPGKVIYDRTDSAFSNLKKGMIDWETIFTGADWFHWSGITPSLSLELAALCKEGLEMASKMGLTISADLNYRPTLWNYGKKPFEVLPDLIKHCDILLGGANDSEMCLNIKTNESDTMEMVFAKWNQEFPKLKTIVATERYEANASGNKASAVLWDGKKLLQSKKYNITHIIDRIGAGDAFMAGIIYGLITWPEDHQNALEFAIAASCLKHTIPGDINSSSANEILALVNGAGGGRMVR
jgi:2-dehydro-3-deoxygluconokinase